MKKYILLLGVFCLGLISCVKEDMPLQDGMVTFSATYNDAPATKTVLEGMKPYWTPTDKISVYDGQNNEFVNAGASNSAATKFKGKLTGKGRKYYLAAYPYNADLTFAFLSKTVYGLVIPTEQTAVAGTYDPAAAVAIAYTEDFNLSFKNMCSLVKFKVISDGVTSVTIKANAAENLAGKFNATWADSPRIIVTAGEKTVTLKGDFKKDETYYIATLPMVLTEGMEVVLNGNIVTMKETYQIDLARSGMVNLGDLSINPSESQKPTNPDEGEDDVVPSDWGLLGVHNEWDTAEPTPMYELGSNFVAFDVPAAAADGFKFKNGDTWIGSGSTDRVALDTWVTAQGEGGQNITFAASADALYDVYFANNTKAFYITLAGSPAPAPMPKPFSGMAVAGTFNGWSTSANPATSEGDFYVLKGVKASMVNSADATGGDKGFKFVYTEEDGTQAWYGAPSASVAASKWYNVNSDGAAANIFVTGDPAADYDVYMTKDRKSFCVVASGAQVPSFDQGGSEGGSQGGEEPGDQGGSDDVVPDPVIYLDPWQWTSDGAVIAAYFFGGPQGDIWVTMNKEGNLYSCTVPKGYTSLLFVRLNPSGTPNDWSSKWNQTEDLTIPSGKNLFTINSWDGGADGKCKGVWSTK